MKIITANACSKGEIYFLATSARASMETGRTGFPNAES